MLDKTSIDIKKAEVVFNGFRFPFIFFGMEKKVSVITINLNNSFELAKTMCSVISQTCFNDMEYIVIDGGSTDGSQDVIKLYEDKLTFVVSEKDNGVYDAMNKGVRHANGEYCIFINSGDSFHTNMSVERALPYLTQDIVYGDLMVNGTRLKKYPDNLPNDYFSYETLPHPSTFIRTELLREKPYDSSYKVISDWIFFKEAIIQEKRTYQHVPFRISNFMLGGISSNANLVREEKERYNITREKMEYDCKISVIVPCYNQGKYVKDTINSLKNQTYKDFVCVLVNDGSTDDTEEVILNETEGDGRFVYYKNENHGLPWTRNFAISKTNSEYILPLDSDDIIAPSYIENAVKYLDEHPDTAIFYGRAKLFWNDGRSTSWNLPAFNYKFLLKNNHIYCSFVYRRKDYERSGGYDDTMDAYEDWEFLIRLLHNNTKVYRTDEVVFYYRQHEESICKKKIINLSQYRNIIREKNIGIYKEYRL